MKKAVAALAGVAALVTMPVGAQTATTSVAAPSTSSAMLRSGTLLPLKMAEALMTKDKATRIGQRVRLEVASDMLVDGKVVVPAGSHAVAEVTDVRNKGMRVTVPLHP